MFNVVWFKRDLRLFDHEPLFTAISNQYPCLLLFVVEPMLLNAEDYSERHWQFMRDCLRDMSSKLRDSNFSSFYILQGDVLDIFRALRKEYGDFQLFSHQETGNHLTFQRDVEIKKWCQQKDIVWKEFKQFGVDRGRKNRQNWQVQWSKLMQKKIYEFPVDNIKEFPLRKSFTENYRPDITITTNKNIQKGGSEEALQVFNSFLQTRHRTYTKHISKPIESRVSCSRLSPHIAWGSISIRFIVQNIAKTKQANSFALKNFKSRLFWHCHFIQKLESDPSLEFRNQNRTYDSIRTVFNQEYYEKYTKGQTGIPMVDASIRCLKETGYLNFRLRAMLVSFWSHLLWQPWTEISKFLARAFTDYEPGIHYAQLQMQSSTIGYHTIRIYNPIKLAKDHDPTGEFIKRWVPELKNLPSDLVIEPWRINPMEEVFYNFVLKDNYFLPIVDLAQSSKRAADVLYALVNTKKSKVIAKSIMKIHVNKKGQS